MTLVRTFLTRVSCLTTCGLRLEQRNQPNGSELHTPRASNPVTREALGQEMLRAYRMFGIFAHEDPIRAVVQTPQVGAWLSH